MDDTFNLISESFCRFDSLANIFGNNMCAIFIYDDLRFMGRESAKCFSVPYNMNLALSYRESSFSNNIRKN